MMASKNANEICSEFGRFFRSNFEICALQKYENLVDLEKCCKNEYLVAIVAVDTVENEPLKA